MREQVRRKGSNGHLKPLVGPNSGSLSADWRLWMAENRLLGVSDQEISITMVEAGHDPGVVLDEIKALSNHPYYIAADRMTQRLKKVNSLLSVQDSLAKLSYCAHQVERRSRVSRDEFLERYYAANRPVILTSLLAGSVARKRWTPQYLARTCGETTVQIMFGRQADSRYEINSEAHKRELKLSEYVTMVLEGERTNDYYMVANNGFFDRAEISALFNEVPQLPEYLDHSDCGKKIFLWFGPAGTITPLHHDLMNVLVAQVYGRKKFLLVSPQYTPYIYNEIGVYAEVDCGRPDYALHPLYRHVQPLEVILNPGEVLFIPVGWWHYVAGLEVSIMLSYINFCFPNEYEWFNPQIRC